MTARRPGHQRQMSTPLMVKVPCRSCGERCVFPAKTKRWQQECEVCSGEISERRGRMERGDGPEEHDRAYHGGPER